MKNLQKIGTVKRSGFTLVEIMVVVVIIGMLAALVGPRLMGQSDEAKIKTTRVQIKNLEQTLELFHLNNGFFPTTDQGLIALIEKPTMPPEPRNYPSGGYLNSKSVPKDAWGNDFIYLCPGDQGDYDIISYGRDGREGGEGVNADISNWD
ncbi:type II secretion system major pseudopilin GspG [Synergistaceae bacterium OttesenSCG-928-I11]|nr:type II secretion system major pseudopilin GspG [Synergistaceae bacterium OttesenSCG-928-I11]